MADNKKFKRVILKLSGEAMAGAKGFGIDPETVYSLAKQIKEVTNEGIEVLATNGDNHLGGDDFDERLTEYLVKEIKNQSRVDVRKDFTAMQRIREAAEIGLMKNGRKKDFICLML